MFSLGTSSLAFIKLLGIGVGLAVLVDAFVIRVTLLPALMKLAGSANWWAPRPFRRIHRHIGISEGEVIAREPDDQAESSRPNPVL